MIIFYFPLITTPITGGLASLNWYMPEGYEWFVLLAIGVLTQVAQFFMTKSYQLEELSKVASLRYLGIIYALSYGYLFFDETFSVGTYVGMAFVMMGVILNIWYKHKKIKNDQLIYQGE